MKTRICKVSRIVILCGSLLVLLPGLSRAEEYPTRPINLTCAFGAGTSVDITGRVLANKAEKLLGQPIIFANNPAGGAMVAPALVAKERPDGYHLLITASVSLAWMPQFRKVNFKHEDFTLILQWGKPQIGIVVRTDAPYKTLKELVEYARKNPEKVTYNSTGRGSPKQVAMDFVAKKENIKWTFIPYDADNLAIAALLGGHVDASAVGTTFIPYVQQGKLRLLATLGEDSRMKAFPNAPTLRELGYDYFEPATYLIAGPKQIPPAIVTKLDEAFRKAMDEPDFAKIMEKTEIDIAYRNSAECKKYVLEVYGIAEKLLKNMNLPKE